MFRLEYCCERQHWLEFVRTAHRRALGLKPAVWGLIIGVIALGLVELMEWFGWYGFDSLSATAALFIMIVVSSLWNLVGLWVFTPSYLKPNGVILGQRTVRVDALGVETRGHHDSTSYDWSAIEAVTLGKKVLVLWVEPAAGIIVSRDAFREPGEETEFIAFVEGRVAATRAPKSV